jgi:pimeloyl-ACP methyl ester carboxylesterase
MNRFHSLAQRDVTAGLPAVLWCTVARGIFFLLAVFWSPVLSAEQFFQLRNGMVIRGSMAEIATLKEGFGAAGATQSALRPIWLIDDGLRRIYIHGRGMVAGAPTPVADLEQPIEFWQPQPLGGKVVAGLGNILGVSAFDPFGRRVIKIRGPEGPVQILQGITELNSRYAKLMALKGNPSLSWDMRIASRSLDSETLHKIFDRRLGQDDLDERLQAVRFFIAAERYGDAKLALQEIMDDFPAELELPAQLIALTELQAAQLLAEAEVRAVAGQYQLASKILNQFPVESVSRVTKIKVQDALGKLNDAELKARTLIEQLQAQVALLDEGRRTALQPLVDEIALGLSADTLARLSDYALQGNVETIPLENRIALAVAGWLLGSGSGEQNLNIVLSLIQVRDLVTRYLASPDAAERGTLLETMRNLEGALPEYVDRMLPLLTPVLPLPSDAADQAIEGLYRIQTADAEYLIQLPPEYNPLRQYPCVLALSESRSDPAGQIDWWAGVYSEANQMRRGHATRQGFIVVAPIWSRPQQPFYEYTPVEHQRVLAALRDAMRRASIDSDRVFIAGHGEGATAAWDIALAHPDLWAGMISISGSPGKTIPHYNLNAEHVPLYIVMGELDQARADGSLIDDYMSFKHDAMIVKYRGRGREYFYDEIPELFNWMQLPAHRRRPPPREFEVSTIRDGDQFFWFVELGELNAGVAVDPILWDQAERLRAGKVSLTIGSDNLITVSGPSETFRVLLRPSADIDLNKPILVRYGSRTKRVEFDGSLEHLMEDVRQRADRNRAFWTSVDIP